MNNSPHITPEEWERIRKYIADGPDHVRLETDENGTAVVFSGEVSGMMHPRAYLQIMEDDYQDLDLTPVDILKHVSNATAPDALIGNMPGSLRGANLLPYKPKPPETE
jgi:hypothetical protein